MRRRAQRPALAGFGCVLAAVCAAGCASAAPDLRPLPSSAAAAEPAGWYEGAQGIPILVTHGPTGGLRILDFETPWFGALPRSDEADSAYVWTVDGVERRATFERAPGGGVRGLRWRANGAEGGFLRRAERFPFDVREVSFASDAVRLAGSVLLPRAPDGAPRAENAPPAPGVVLIHGSGDSDRDNVWAYHIAQAVARRGAAVLIPDKRGSGASGGDWRRADFAVLAHDALAGAGVLRALPEVDGGCIGVLGLSQGGWIAPLAAGLDGGLAFVVNVSGAAVPPAGQLAHEVEQDLRAAGFGPDDIDRGLAFFRLADAYAARRSDDAWAAYADAREALLRDTLSSLAEALPADTADWWWGWWRGVRAEDPLPRWRSLERPGLVVYGSEDESDNVPVRESVRRLGALGARAPDVRVYEGSGHALGDDVSGWIREDFLAETASWILDACRGP